ncbi:MAG: hypothetical protein SVG88_10030 [Halobacteriales archaeon]|nr:hypothetical protein [Halobacteriales archaeon]
MADPSDSTVEDEDEAEIEEEEVDVDTTETDVDDEVVLDIDAAEEYEAQIERLEEQVQSQAEEIDKLQNLLTDLSARVADGNDMGVCPDCHGPVVKQRRWFRSNTIECTRCGRVFHEY